MHKQIIYGLLSRVLYRGKLALDWIGDSYNRYVLYKLSRDYANRIRKKIIVNNGLQIADKRELKKIKEYCRESFGSSAYWPWLALYTELRGKFKEGWVPDDYYRFELLPRMNPERYVKFSEAKCIDHKLFEDLIVEPLFFQTNGLYCRKDGTIISDSEVLKLLSNLDSEIIIKPDEGRGGYNILFKHSKDLCLKDLPVNTDFLVQKVVKQHSELDKLYPNSVNTFRVSTLYDEQGTIRINYIILRFGVDGSRLDNISSGGGWTLVRVNGKVDSYGYNNLGIELGTKHPNTGTTFSELEFPYFENIIALCKSAHKEFPFNRIIGWDVYVDVNGKPELIEWNANNPSFWKAEAIYGPFFSDII